MASIRVDGLSELMTDLLCLETLPIEVILNESADVIVSAQRKAAPKNTGTLSSSIKKGAPKRFRGSAFIEIKPDGINHTTKSNSKSGKSGNTGKKRGSTGNKVTNMEVAFIHEFGAPARNIQAKQWIRTANEKAEGEVEAVALRVYDEHLKKHNL